ncbi:MAG: hypothetical protein QME60_08815 [Verrucomicrobiota bacterium]|nr:hypothetical protein [Verrucomicrobiota bacterium]
MIRAAMWVPWFALAVLAAIPAELSAVERKSPASRESPEDTFIREAEVKLHDRLFGAGELRACERYLKNARGRDRLRLLVILSQYRRWMEKNPVAALDAIGETVLSRATIAEWKKVRAVAERQALEQWQKDSAKARAENAGIPPRPAGLAIPFPATDQWTVGTSNVECAIEIAHAHMDMGLWQDALRIADMLGRNHEGIIRVLAGECGADAMMGMSRFKQAVDLYRFALGALSALASRASDLPPEYQPIKRRIEASLALALRQQEIEAYGLGYVLYRDARRKHHADKARLEALPMYEDLARQFDKTVYAEAGRAYACQCLLALAEPDSIEKAQESIRQQEEIVKAHESKLALMKQAKVPKAAIGEVESAMAREKRRLARLRAVPGGKQAATLANVKGMSFVKENEFGLYRGETLVELAGYAFDRELDSSAAERLYRRAWNWLEQVEKVDARLDAYEAPDKARAVSVPPQTEEKVDYFGNVDRVTPPPEAIVNRRTCPWYLNDLRERCALALGFLEFVKGNREEALDWFAKVVALDSATRYLASKGEANNFRRMKWAVEHGYLVAYPDELKLYKGRQRFAVLLGDFYYCTERFKKAGEIARRLLDGDFGKMEGELREYPQLLLGLALSWTEGRKPAFVVLEKALKEASKRRHRTFTQDRIQFVLGNIPPMDLDVDMMDRGYQYTKTLAYSQRTNEYVYRARLLYGWRLLETPDEAEGIKVLQSIPESATPWKAVANYYLLELEEERWNKGREGK